MAKEKIGLTLAGGGTRGAYQVGVYKAMIASKIKISGVTGTSIGSFNAAFIAASDIKKLEHFWTTSDFNDMMGFLTEINKDEKTFFSYLKEFSKPYRSVIKNRGISITKLKDSAFKFVNEKKVLNSKLDFGLVTYKVKDSQSLYLFKEDIKPGELVNYIIGSCYLPVFKYEKLNDDSYYLDGAFLDNEPYDMLFSRGYSKVYIVELGAMGVTRKHKGQETIVRIKPSRNLGGLLNTDKTKIKNNISLGYYDGLKIFKNLDGNKFIFKVYGDAYYNLLLKNVPKRLRKRIEVFFLTRNNRDLVLKSIEYVLKREGATYFKIYSPFWELRRIKKLYKYDKKIIVYEFISYLKLF